MSKYKQRDVIAVGQIYVDHVSAMTVEGLHSKSDIAAELAHRDLRIAKLEHQLAECQALLEAVAEALDRALGDSDITHIEDDEEIRRRYPVQWACSQINMMLNQDDDAAIAMEMKDEP